MSPEALQIAQWTWLGLGVVLMLAEFFLPGIIAVFFGAGGILTALFVALGYLQTFPQQVFFWVLSSFILLMILRRQVRRWFPALESYNPYEEDKDIAGREVEVVEDIVPGESTGRVRFQGTTWSATSDTPIAAGEKARVMSRENLLLTVERR